jgi:hypothetical protein
MDDIDIGLTSPLEMTRGRELFNGLRMPGREGGCMAQSEEIVMLRAGWER